MSERCVLGEAGDFLLWIIWRVHPSLGRKGEAAIPPLTASRCVSLPASSWEVMGAAGLGMGFLHLEGQGRACRGDEELQVSGARGLPQPNQPQLHLQHLPPLLPLSYFALCFFQLRGEGKKS